MSALLGTATYSPDDNKLRLYADSRLDDDDYATANGLGFKWAPKQGLFVAPMWTPAREDLLLKWCGEIGDEDTSLVERSEERAERFDTYSDKRASDAQRAQDGVSAIAGGIPLGQPILIGHHSEKGARRDADKIENGMRRAVKMWDTSTYWTQRAAGALHHAQYKERPDVRARRIKKINADKRRNERSEKEGAAWGALIASIDGLKKAHDISELTWWYVTIDGEQRRAHDLLRDEVLTWQELRAKTLEGHERSKGHRARWAAHYKHRLGYETAMLEAQGGADLLKPKARPKQLPLCNYRAPDGLTIENKWNPGKFETLPQREMTKAEYKAIWHESRGTRVVDNSHRVRIGIERHKWFCVFITDGKDHKRPEPVEAKPQMTMRSAPDPAPKTHRVIRTIDPAIELRKSLAAGVQIAVAPTLFPTPPALAARMVELASIDHGNRVLEPSAGTGAILDALPGVDVCETTAVEIDAAIVRGVLTAHEGAHKLVCVDFLEWPGEPGKFDRIIMNPPFNGGADIKHIEHARTLLKPGGRIVALCANGPRQNEKLKPLADFWEELPAGTFAGTQVRAALLVIEG